MAEIKKRKEQRECGRANSRYRADPNFAQVIASGRLSSWREFRFNFIYRRGHLIRKTDARREWSVLAGYFAKSARVNFTIANTNYPHIA